MVVSRREGKGLTAEGNVQVDLRLTLGAISRQLYSVRESENHDTVTRRIRLLTTNREITLATSVTARAQVNSPNSYQSVQNRASPHSTTLHPRIPRPLRRGRDRTSPPDHRVAAHGSRSPPHPDQRRIHQRTAISRNAGEGREDPRVQRLQQY